MKTKSKHYKNRMFFNECTGVSVCEIINPAQSFSFSCAYRGIFQFLQNGNFQFWCSYVWGILQPYKLITDTERDIESKRKRPPKYQGIPKSKSGHRSLQMPPKEHFPNPVMLTSLSIPEGTLSKSSNSDNQLLISLPRRTASCELPSRRLTAQRC